MSKIKIGISIGDPSGIGMEIIIKTFKDNRILDFCTPIIFGSSKISSLHRKILKMQEFNFNLIKNIDDASPKKTNLLNLLTDDIDINLGDPSVKSGELAFKSFKSACLALKEKKIDALVTAPIHKSSIQEKLTDFIGHTEFLEKNFNGNSLMIMISDVMKIAFVTGHVPLKKIEKYISKEKINDKILALEKSLKEDFGINVPKIAVLGLNPHAGEDGLLGDEEKKYIIPTIKKLKSDGKLVFGPYSADSFFVAKNLKNFDGILAMYHDQGLIPFKSLSFTDGINFTSGLDVIRTSPVHGTAFEIAGKGIANENSFRQAIFSACKIAHKRKEFKHLNLNPLPFSSRKKNK